jgi:hypothetical protein
MPSNVAGKDKSACRGNTPAVTQELLVGGDKARRWVTQAPSK